MEGLSHSRTGSEGENDRRTPDCVRNLSSVDFPERTHFVIGEDIEPTDLELLISDYVRAFQRAKQDVPSDVDVSTRRTTVDVLEQVIKYAMTGELQIRGLDDDTLLSMLSLAYRYRLEKLAWLLDRLLKKKVTVTNVCDMCVKALRNRYYRLSDFCYRFMDLHADVILRSESFCRLPAKVLNELLSRDSFYAPEIEIFQAVKRWCKQRPMDEDSFEVLNKVRLNLISLEDLFRVVEPSSLIPTQRLTIEVNGRNESTDTKLIHPRGILVPGENLATADHRARLVCRGPPPVCSQQKKLPQPFDWDQRVLKHDIGNSNGIVIALSKPHIINRLILHLVDGSAFSYYVEMLTSANDWNRVIDHTNQLRRSTQRFYFKPRVVRYIRVVGTHCTRGNKFLLESIAAFYSDQPDECDEEGHASYEPMDTDCDFNEEQLSFMSTD